MSLFKSKNLTVITSLMVWIKWALFSMLRCFQGGADICSVECPREQHSKGWQWVWNIVLPCCIIFREKVSWWDLCYIAFVREIVRMWSRRNSPMWEVFERSVLTQHEGRFLRYLFEVCPKKTLGILHSMKRPFVVLFLFHLNIPARET